MLSDGGFDAVRKLGLWNDRSDLLPVAGDSVATELFASETIRKPLILPLGGLEAGGYLLD